MSFMSSATKKDINAVLRTTPTTIFAVREMLNALQPVLASIPPAHNNNTMASFNELYKDITATVLGYKWQDRDFLELLDVEFAKRYFSAVRLFGSTSPSPPKSWRVLFNLIEAQNISPLQSALAGVNTHVNFDLAFALVATFEGLGVESIPPAGSPRYHDYVSVNHIFEQRILGLCVELESSPIRAMAVPGRGTRLDEIENDVAMQLVRYSRHQAWKRAEKLWGMRGSAKRLLAAETKLDFEVSIMNKLILSPALEVAIDWDFHPTP